jgi:beta-lactam-binding protein with PASTA domain
MKIVISAALAVFLIAGSTVLCQSDDKGKVESQASKAVAVPNVVGKALAEAITALDSAGFNIKTSGSGSTIKTQTPAANTKVAPGSTVTLTR